MYAIGFVVGPSGATRECLGISLYGIASVLTFPFVPLASHLGWPLGILVFPLNSGAWAACFYLLLGLAAHLAKRRARDR